MTCLHAIMANGHIRQRNTQTTGLYKIDILEDGRGREEEEKVTKFIIIRHRIHNANFLNKESLKITYHINNLNQNFILPGQSTINSLAIFILAYKLIH